MPVLYHASEGIRIGYQRGYVHRWHTVALCSLRKKVIQITHVIQVIETMLYCITLNVDVGAQLSELHELFQLGSKIQEEWDKDLLTF